MNFKFVYNIRFFKICVYVMHFPIILQLLVWGRKVIFVFQLENM